MVGLKATGTVNWNKFFTASGENRFKSYFSIWLTEKTTNAAKKSREKSNFCRQFVLHDCTCSYLEIALIPDVIKSTFSGMFSKNNLILNNIFYCNMNEYINF